MKIIMDNRPCSLFYKVDVESHGHRAGEMGVVEGERLGVCVKRKIVVYLGCTGD